ncbi:MAG: hypothetical protein AMXMBFR81_17470 [Chthonomonas sp.]
MAINERFACKGYQAWTSRPDALARFEPTRRGVLAALGLGTVSWLGARSAFSQLVVAPARVEQPTLVVVFLRGGMDGLNVVVPYGDDDYHRLRPNLALRKAQVLDLDGTFGLHPRLAPLLPLYREGSMAIVHAVGSGDQTRSHFEAMAAMERGLFTDSDALASGWLARYLRASPGTSSSPLRAVAFGPVLPDSLRGATQATAIASLDDYRLTDGKGKLTRDAFAENLRRLYGKRQDEVSLAGFETLNVLDALHSLEPSRRREGGPYPETAFGDAVRQCATLLKAEVGVEAACLDMGGWDTHVYQGSVEGWQAGLLDELARSLAAFVADLGPRMKRTTIVVMTEFGRRVKENEGLGTDHGRGSALFALGAGVQGGRLYVDWPGLGPDALEGPGDLRVTTDYRNVLWSDVSASLGEPGLNETFPGLQPDAHPALAKA